MKEENCISYYRNSIESLKLILERLKPTVLLLSDTLFNQLLRVLLSALPLEQLLHKKLEHDDVQSEMT